MDTIKFEVENNDGTIEIMPANIIAENIMSRVDEQGHKQMMIDEIISHEKSDVAVNTQQSSIINLIKKLHTTRGWKLCVQWKNGSSSWVSLKDIKNGYPVETAHYTIKNHLQDVPQH